MTTEQTNNTTQWIEVYSVIFGSSRIWLADLVSLNERKCLVNNMAIASSSLKRCEKLAKELAPPGLVVRINRVVKKA